MKLIVVRPLPFGDTILPKGSVLSGEVADHVWNHERLRENVTAVSEDQLPDSHHGNPVRDVPQALKDLAKLTDAPDAPKDEPEQKSVARPAFVPAAFVKEG